MRIEYWHELDLNSDGTLGQPVEPWRGSMHTEPGIETSYGRHYNTPSARRNPYWMYVTTGRLKDGSIHGITICFDSEDEMRTFFLHPLGIGEVNQ